MSGKKDRNIQFVVNTIFILFFIIIIYQWTNESSKLKHQSQIQLKALQKLSCENIRTFRVYHETQEFSLTFSPSGPLVKEFVSSLKDIHSYSFNHDTVKQDQQGKLREWGIEMYATGVGQLFLIYFYAPGGGAQKNIIVGKIGTLYFQSELLYHWYQKYSHRWLEPEDAQPTPTPQP